MVSVICAAFILAPPSVFPSPTQVHQFPGSADVRRGVRIEIQGVAQPARIRHLVGGFLNSDLASSRSVPLRLIIDPNAPEGAESYQLRVRADGISASARTERGLIWSMQTLRQLIRNQAVACTDIRDVPKASWRGVLLDEGRHFMGEATVKQFLDVMALYKYNVLHWHLTEDQGWRIEIKKYPRLTQVGAWRTEADGKRYGGFYTQAQIKRIVSYAADRGITIVPEIEMPGHCTSALAAYPNLGCRNAVHKVPTTWGVFTDVYCAGRESTFAFLENVLSEVIPLFRSPYFHIGGDEVPKTQWDACTDCQARIRAEGLADSHELQSWFIKRIQRFLKSKGKTLIGWDEIIDGGLAPGAVVQVWQDIARANLAAKTGNSVVLSPSSHTYLNRPANDLPMKVVYEQKLVPDGLDRKLVLGHEVTLWSEHITPDNLFERFLPRGIAAAEIFWRDPERDWASFDKSLNAHLGWLDANMISYGPADQAISSIRLVPSSRSGFGRIDVKTGMKSIVVRATVDGTAPTFRSTVVGKDLEFPIGKTVRARAFRGGKAVDDEREFRSIRHVALARTPELSSPPAPRYANAGLGGLTDGFLGSLSFDDGIWLGWQGQNVSATIDLGSVRKFDEISLGCLQQVGSWILLPKSVRFEVSADGKSWKEWGMLKSPLSDRDPATKVFRFRVAKPGSARYIRATAESYGKLPSWHLGAGGESWLFADELVVR